MQHKTLHIPNISCGHCVASIKDELGEIDGVASVEGNPDEKRITVAWDAPATLEAIQRKLTEINYPTA